MYSGALLDVIFGSEQKITICLKVKIRTQPTDHWPVCCTHLGYLPIFKNQSLKYQFSKLIHSCPVSEGHIYLILSK